MKTTLLISFFMVIILTGCNNRHESVIETASSKDSIGASLIDLTSSKDIKHLLTQSWENKEDADDAASSGGGEEIEMTYRGFSFFEDATVVVNPRDNIRFGKWKFSDADKMVTIQFNKGTPARYKIVAIGPKQMILMDTEDKKKTEYQADGKVQINTADDPFYISNNQWRIKPIKPESDSAIKERTAQCVLFYSKFLADNANRDKRTISFAGLPTCFKWYRGGVSVTSKKNLEARWINCYYNREQALKAQTMLEDIITKKYKWKKGQKRWVLQSADVVKQIYDTLRLL